MTLEGFVDQIGDLSDQAFQFGFVDQDDGDDGEDGEDEEDGEDDDDDDERTLREGGDADMSGDEDDDDDEEGEEDMDDFYGDEDSGMHDDLDSERGDIHESIMDGANGDEDQSSDDSFYNYDYDSEIEDGASEGTELEVNFIPVENFQQQQILPRIQSIKASNAMDPGTIQAI